MFEMNDWTLAHSANILWLFVMFFFLLCLDFISITRFLLSRHNAGLSFCSQALLVPSVRHAEHKSQQAPQVCYLSGGGKGIPWTRRPQQGDFHHWGAATGRA